MGNSVSLAAVESRGSTPATLPASPGPEPRREEFSAELKKSVTELERLIGDNTSAKQQLKQLIAQASGGEKSREAQQAIREIYNFVTHPERNSIGRNPFCAQHVTASILSQVESGTLAALAIGLQVKGEFVSAGGLTIKASPVGADLNPNNTATSLFKGASKLENLVYSSLMDVANGSQFALKIDPTTKQVVNSYAGRAFSGTFHQEFSEVLASLLGSKWNVTRYDFLPPDQDSQSRQKLLNTLRNGDTSLLSPMSNPNAKPEGNKVAVQLSWAQGGEHSEHVVSALGVFTDKDKKQWVVVENSWGSPKSDIGDLSQFGPRTLRFVSGDSSRTRMMIALDDFVQRVNHLTVVAQSGSEGASSGAKGVALDFGKGAQVTHVSSNVRTEDLSIPLAAVPAAQESTAPVISVGDKQLMWRGVPADIVAPLELRKRPPTESPSSDPKTDHKPPRPPTSPTQPPFPRASRRTIALTPLAPGSESDSNASPVIALQGREDEATHT